MHLRGEYASCCVVGHKARAASATTQRVTVPPFASLRSRLFLVVATAVTPFVLYAALVAARGKSAAQTSLRETSLGRARTTAHNLDLRLKTIEQLLDSAMTLAQLPTRVMPTLKLPDSSAHPLSGLLTIAVLDSSGSPTGLLLGAASRAERIPIMRRRSLLATAGVGVAEKRGAALPSTFIDEGALRSETDSIAMILARPLVKGKKRCDCLAAKAGAVVAVLSDSAVQRLLGSDTIPDGSVAVLTGNSGRLLGRPRMEERWIEPDSRAPSTMGASTESEGVIQVTGLDRVHRTVGYATLERLPWRVYVGVATSSMAAAPTQHLRDTLMLALLALAVAGVGVVLASRALSGPVQTLVADTKRLAAGALHHRTSVDRATGDLGELGAAMNSLAADLEMRRKQAQEELRRSTQIFENSPVAMWVTDASFEGTSAGRILQANAAASRLFGVEAGALVGQRDADLFNAVGAQLLTASPVLLDDGSAAVRTGRVSIRTARETGHECQLHISFFPHASPPRRVVTILDQVQTARATDDLRDTDLNVAAPLLPSDSLSEFAGNVAADFSELLQGLEGFAQLAHDSEDDPDMRTIAVERIRDLTARGLDLARQVRAYGQRAELQHVLVDANATLTDALQEMADTLGSDIELDVRYSDTPAMVRVDLPSLNQVITALISNARDAMPAGGTLTLATTAVEVPLELGQRYAAPPGKYVVLTIADTGMGMSADARARMFDPFWSTKRQQGRGTGLSLAAVAGLAAQHGWRITVDTEPEVGTAVSLYMPFDYSTPSETESVGDQATLETVPARSA